MQLLYLSNDVLWIWAMYSCIIIRLAAIIYAYISVCVFI